MSQSGVRMWKPEINIVGNITYAIIRCDMGTSGCVRIPANSHHKMSESVEIAWFERDYVVEYSYKIEWSIYYGIYRRIRQESSANFPGIP